MNNLISVGSGREAAFAAAVLGDNVLMEKAWQDTGMLAEAVLHAQVCQLYLFCICTSVCALTCNFQAHGRPTLKNLVESWNKMLQKEMDHTSSEKTDAAAAFFASLEEPKLTTLADASKKPPIEILPPGVPTLSSSILAPKKPTPGAQGALQQPAKPLLLEAPPADPQQQTEGTPTQSEPTEQTSDGKAPTNTAATDMPPTTSVENVPITLNGLEPSDIQLASSNTTPVETQIVPPSSVNNTTHSEAVLESTELQNSSVPHSSSSNVAAPPSDTPFEVPDLLLNTYLPNVSQI